MDRRIVLGLLGAAVFTREASSAATAVPSAPLALDLSRPGDNLTTWMKMRGSLESQDVYFWFTGGLDVAIPGEPIRPFVNVESLILRRTQRMGAGIFHITDWEASFYRHPETGEVVDELRNPVTGKVVRPLHYREGPVTFEYSAQRQPRLVGLPTPFAEKKEPFHQPWRIVGDTLWMTKASYVSGRPQWLDIKEFPDETPATPMTVAAVAVMESRLSAVLDPVLASVPVSYSYQATSDWLPWMQLGQRPGFVVWHENGKKLFSLNELPEDSLAVLKRLHPIWFTRPVPWEGFTNLFFQYREQRGRR